MVSMNFDFHLHTIYSQDSILHPQKIIKVAKRKGLRGIAVTDHDTIKGALKTKAIVGKDDTFKVIIGAEVKTNCGDVIGLFLDEDIISKDFIKVCDEIKKQGGVVVLPHPYRRKDLFALKELLKYVDLMEVLNARISKNLNYKAQLLAKEQRLTSIGGSDAHTSFEIGRVQTILEDCASLDDNDIRKCLLNGEVRIVGTELPFYLRILSTGIGKYKKEGFTSLIKAGCRIALSR